LSRCAYLSSDTYVARDSDGDRTYNAPTTATPSAFVAAINMNSKWSGPMPDKESTQDAFNLDAIATLAEETHQPFEVVKDVYEEQFARLSAGARITDYLVLFASRRTRDVLVGRGA
jgi:hypothetical protein